MQQMKSFQKSMDGFSDSMVENQKKRGKPAEVHHRAYLLTHEKWLPPSKGNPGEWICSIRPPITEAEFDEREMKKLFRYQVFIHENENHPNWAEHNKDAIRIRLRQLACRAGADGYIKVSESDSEVVGIAWAYKENMQY